MPESTEKPPARPFFRKLSWVIAAISFLCALVSVTGFMGADNRLFGTLIFLFCGFIFTTICPDGILVSPCGEGSGDGSVRFDQLDAGHVVSAVLFARLG